MKKIVDLYSVIELSPWRVDPNIEYLQLFRNENMSINELFEWIKTKRMDYMDAPTRKWAEKNM